MRIRNLPGLFWLGHCLFQYHSARILDDIVQPQLAFYFLHKFLKKASNFSVYKLYTIVHIELAINNVLCS